ncbi:hypothetical protein [Flavobacterium sp. FlaQc-50]|uniref:hypothetical protein n=1 Tax=unclassified Flavobacterium TaxID=196869 RepID=UPI003756FC5B
MKKILIVAFAVGVIALGFVVREIQDLNFEQRLERMNAHIKYLHDEEGYSWESARKIGAVEAGFIPMDKEYNSLIED